MINEILSEKDVKYYSLSYLMERKEPIVPRVFKSFLNKSDKLTLKPIKDLSDSELIYLLKKRKGINFLIIVLVNQLTETGFIAKSFNSSETPKQESQKEIIKELLLIPDSFWQENNTLYLKFKNVIECEKHWIIFFIVPEYVIEHFLNLEITESIVIEDIVKLPNGIDLDHASGYFSSIERVLRLRRATDNGVKLLTKDNTEITDFEEYLKNAIKSLPSSDKIFLDITKEVRIIN